MKNIWRLFSLLPSYKSRLVKVVIVNSLLGLSGLAIPFLFRNVMNEIVSAVRVGWSFSAERTLLVSLGLILAVYFTTSIFDYIAERLSSQLFADVVWEIRQKVFYHMTTLSVDYYEQHRSGEILEKIGTGTMDFAQWIYAISDGVLSTVALIIFVLVYMWLKIPLIGLIMTLSLTLNFYWSIRRIIRAKQIRREWHRQAERATGEMTETINQIATVRSFASEDYKFQRYADSIKQVRVLRLKQFQIEWNNNFYRSLLNGVTVVGAIGVVALRALHGIGTIGDILLVSLYLQQLRGNIGPITRTIVNTADLETSAERMTTILDVQPSVTDRPDAVELTNINSIEFQNVSFAYPGHARQILQGVSFKISQGKSVALVGPSGVGKTTITKLLMRFYAPTAGQILINDQPVEHFTQNSIRAKIGTVMQDVALFNDTVEENLRFAAPKATQTEIEAAAKVAHADVFIEKLADRYQTLVGERGIRLSGGEKQRVAIARSVLRNPDLIILDEATSSLDSESEKFVQDGLAKLLKNRTSLMIAHRLSTIQRADQIVVLENGRVKEVGRHEDLIKNKQLYARLLAIQSTPTS